MYRFYRLLLFFVLFVSINSCQNKSTLFTSLDADDTGIRFNNFVEEEADNNVLRYGYFYNGGGVATGDFNNDGLVDVYFTGNMVADKLYLNGGNMHFEDVTEAAGIKHDGWKTGVSVVDINSDGWLDLYICRSGAENPDLRQNLLYVNQGTKELKFIEKAAEYGLNDDSYTTQAAFFDYDKDGDLDCFLLNHSIQQYAGFSNMIATYRTQSDNRYGSKLLQNNKGMFSDISAKAGIINNVMSFGLGINVSDFNNDGWLDLYISNDYNENDYLYLNQQNGTYKESIRASIGHTSLYSMGTDAADINNDGWIDIATLDMLPENNDRIKLTAGDDNYDKYQMLLKAGFHDQTMRNMLHINQALKPNKKIADSTSVSFSEIGQLAGVSNTDWSWSALFADFDNDGLKDLFITNGYARDYTNMEFLKYSTDIQASNNKVSPSQIEVIEKMPAINEFNYIFRNKDGLIFEKKISEWGFDTKSQSNGSVYADLDNDGDLDLITNNINKKAFVYRNNSYRDTAKFLSVELKTPSEALKVGAKVAVWSSGKVQYQEFQPVRGFQSSMYAPLHFGMGSNQNVDSVLVNWSDGGMTKIGKTALNQKIVIDYKTKTNQPKNSTTLPLITYYTEIPIDASHQQEPINDFKTQPLLPEMLSNNGPCMAKGDVNGDGLDDVYIGGSRQKSGQLWTQTKGGFIPSKQIAFDANAAYNDADALFVDIDADHDLDLLVVSSGYHLNPTDPLLQPRLYVNNNGLFIKKTIIKQVLNINASCVAAADVDLDGDQDVFIGAHCSPGRYPETQKSLLLKNDGKGNFSIGQVISTSLINDAVFTDFNKDNKPDLIVVGEWSKPTVFLNKNTKFVADYTITQSLLSSMGRVISPAADLDNDGDQDFVLGNIGTNNQFNITANEGLNLYYSDFSDNGTIIPVMTLLKDGQEYPYASRDELLDQIPVLRKKYADYTSFSNASIKSILDGTLMKKAKILGIKEYKTGILWNTDGKLVFEPLPTEAQFAPIYAIEIIDINGDGKKDIILAGNNTKTRVRLGKSDANKGQLFINEGNKKFIIQPQSRSGIQIEGDVRAVIAVNNYLWFGVNNKSIRMFVATKNTSK